MMGAGREKAPGLEAAKDGKEDDSRSTHKSVR